MAVEATGKSRRGVRIGSYELFAPLTSWGKGFYRAQDIALDRTVTLKILDPELAGDAVLRDQCQRQAQRASQARHETILTVYEFGEANGTWYVALELADGAGLADYVQKNAPLAALKAARLLSQAARALQQAQRLGLDYRDVSLRSFLVLRKDNQDAVKWIPLAWLRQPRSAEDKEDKNPFAAPELVNAAGHDLRADDVRGALYSLGVLWFYLLTGEPPRAGDPEPWAALESEIPEAHLRLLQRLLARKPEERFSSLAPLIDALEVAATDAATDAAAATDADAAAAAPAPPSSKKPKRRLRDDSPSLADLAELAAEAPAAAEPESARRPAAPETDEQLSVRSGKPKPFREEEEDKPAGNRWPPPKWLIPAGAGGALLIIIVVVLLSLRGERTPVKKPDDGLAAKKKDDSNEGKRDGVTPPDGEGDKKKAKPPPQERPPSRFTPLYQPAEPLDLGKLHDEFEAPWVVQPELKDPPVYMVRRLPAATVDAKFPKSFTSLAEACAAAPEGEWTIIEIQDNGPFVELPMVVTGRSLLIRAGEGFRPLIVWDVERWAVLRREGKVPPPAGPPALLSVDKGNLVLEKVDLAVDWSETGQPACLVRLSGGDFFSLGCTYSAAGKPSAGALVRFDGDARTRSRCRLNQCITRAKNWTALDVRAPAADVFVDHCLAIGGDAPVIRCQADLAPATGPIVRMRRSTLLAAQKMFQVQGPDAANAKPAMQWLGWDVLLARDAKDTGGTLLDLPPAASPDALRWRAVNCLYLGWQTLLSGKQPIPATAWEAWKKRWDQPEGDKAIAAPWPIMQGMQGQESAEISPYIFGPEDYPARFLGIELRCPAVLGERPWTWLPRAFAATHFPEGDVVTNPNDEQPLGCNRKQLPWARQNWRALAYRGYPIEDPVVVADAKAPPIPKESKEGFTGGRVDLNKTDLGDYLRGVQKTQALAPVVILHLTGSGPCKTSPIRLKNTSLVLYFEPTKKGPPPVLVPDLKGEPAPDQTGFIQIEGGFLDMIGGEIRCPDDKTAKLPPYLIHVVSVPGRSPERIEHGSLRIHGAKLFGPITQPPPAYRGLIRLDGTGVHALDESRRRYWLRLHESTLVSAGSAVHVGGGSRVHIEQCVIVSAQDALYFQPPRISHHLNLRCTMQNTTVAARRAVLRLGDTPDAPAGTGTIDPIVMHTKANVYTNPFLAEDGKSPAAACMVLDEGLALPRGVLTWQSEFDAFDSRLRAYALAAGPDGNPPKLDAPQPFTAWQRLWGPLGSRQPFTALPFQNTLALDKLQLDQLVCPPCPINPGANFERLGIVKKAKK